MQATHKLEIVEVERRDGRATLRVSGALDSSGARTLLRRGTRVLDQGHHLVLDLAGVTFIGSTGVGALLMLYEDQQQHGLTMRLVAISEAVRGVIELLDLRQTLALDRECAPALAGPEERR